MATGLDISSEDFMAGSYYLGTAGSVVINRGLIQAATGENWL